MEKINPSLISRHELHFLGPQTHDDLRSKHYLNQVGIGTSL